MSEDPLTDRFTTFRTAVGHAGYRPPVEAVQRRGARRTRTRRTRFALGVAFAAALTVVAFTGLPHHQPAPVAPAAPSLSPSVSPSASVPPAPTTAGTPSTPPSATGASSIPTAQQAGKPCLTSSLTFTLAGSSSAKFQQSATLQFLNKATVICTLSGYPQLTFSHNGAAMPVTLKHNTTPPVTTVQLQPGRTADAHLIWNKDDSQGNACKPLATTVAVTPPGQHTATTIPWLADPVEASICGGTLTTDPIVTH
jgi:hypothetical protein